MFYIFFCVFFNAKGVLGGSSLTEGSWVSIMNSQESPDDEYLSPTRPEEVQSYRERQRPDGMNYTTAWLPAYIGYCVGPRSRLLWWFEQDVYIIREQRCTLIQERTGSLLFLGTEDRLRCIVRNERPLTTVTFGKRSSLLVAQRLQECDKLWSENGVREVIKYAALLEQASPVLASSIQLNWLREFRSAATMINKYREETCALPDLLRGIRSNDIPKVGFEFEYAPAYFENCDWTYGDVLGYTAHMQSSTPLLQWTAEDICRLELRTIARSLEIPSERKFIIASILTSYFIWANMLQDNVPFSVFIASAITPIDSILSFPASLLNPIRKRLGDNPFTLVSESDHARDFGNITLRQGGKTTGMSTQMNAGLPFLIYDPVCLEIWQSENILTQNDNPIPRVMSNSDFVERIKTYGEPYIRAMLGYLLEIFLTIKYDSTIDDEDTRNYRNYYNLFPKVNWQKFDRSEEDPLHFVYAPSKSDFKLYREGLKIFKREFAFEIIKSGIEFGSHAWRDLTSKFRSPRYADFYRRRQYIVKRNSFAPFVYKGHVYIVCEFRGISLRGLMSGRLNLLMMRGASDASHFRPGETYLYPDLMKIDQVLKRVLDLQTQQFNRNCLPILHAEQGASSSGISSFEIEHSETRAESEASIRSEANTLI